MEVAPDPSSGAAVGCILTVDDEYMESKPYAMMPGFNGLAGIPLAGDGSFSNYSSKEIDLTTDEYSSSRLTLDQVAMGETFAVLNVNAPTLAPEWGAWLEEIGFVPGELVRLMAKAFPGGDPMVVRVGQSTFALRRAEAACVGVAPVESHAAAASMEQMAVEGRKA